jgi:hypothetical protein
VVNDGHVQQEPQTPQATVCTMALLCRHNFADFQPLGAPGIFPQIIVNLLV